MMISPEKLLSLDPLYALKSMISEHWPMSKPEWFVIEEINAEESRSEIKVRARLSNLYVPFIIRAKYKDNYTFKLSRLNISVLNNRGPIKLFISSIKKELGLVDMLTSHFKSKGNILFSKEDFVEPDMVLQEGSTSAIVSDGSYRWYGILNLLTVVVKEYIEEYVKRTNCIMDHTPTFSTSTVKSTIVNSLNQQNSATLPVPLIDAWCSIDPVTVEIIGNESDQINTKITLHLDDASSPYQGQLDITYGRRSFYKTYTHPVKLPLTVTTEQDILDVINNKLGAGLTAGELLLPESRPVGIHPINIVQSSIAHVGLLWVDYE